MIGVVFDIKQKTSIASWFSGLCTIQVCELSLFLQNATLPRIFSAAKSRVVFLKINLMEFNHWFWNCGGYLFPGGKGTVCFSLVLGSSIGSWPAQV
jgi:hypothetical protein